MACTITLPSQEIELVKWEVFPKKAPGVKFSKTDMRLDGKLIATITIKGNSGWSEFFSNQTLIKLVNKGLENMGSKFRAKEVVGTNEDSAPENATKFKAKTEIYVRVEKVR